MGMSREGLLVLDYDCAPLAGNTFMAAAERVLDLAARCKVGLLDAVCIYAAPEMVRPMMVAGVTAEPIPAHLLDAETLLIPAASHIAAGGVKLCAPAHMKAQTSPFGGALDFRGGDKGDDPLRRAALWAIALGLDPQ